MLKSVHSTTQVSVVFINCTERDVDIFWTDFKGQFVRYRNKLPHNHRYGVNTFETHPWIAKDSKTGASLHMRGNSVFMPQLDERTEIQEARITLPVYTLIDRCLDVLRSHGVQNNAAELEIPSILKQELKKEQIPSCKEYRPSRR